jgi:hypothetical protein
MNLGGILGWSEEKKGMIFEGAFKKGAGQKRRFLLLCCGEDIICVIDKL